MKNIAAQMVNFDREQMRRIANIDNQDMTISVWVFPDTDIS
ncbi:TPA: phage replication protein, partial [Escherichia coli O157:H7]|nr:phage replication protein [Escherichia coli O157:H7]